MFQSDNELKALAEAGAPRLKCFQPVILGGFTKGVPSKVKLWDIKPPIPDDLEPTQYILAEQFNANEEQVEATKRAYSASAGLSLVHGGPKTGKTATSLLQALATVSMGHKVILCAPARGSDDLESLFGKHWSEMSEGGTPKVYIARNPGSEAYLTKYCELAEASNHPGRTMPVTLGHGVWQALRENIRIFNSPENQTLYKDAQQYHPSLQHLVKSQLLWDLMPTIRDDLSEDERLAITEVPVYEMKHQFFPLRANQQHEANPEAVSGGGRIARNKPCPCGSQKKYKRCFAIDEKLKGRG